MAGLQAVNAAGRAVAECGVAVSRGASGSRVFHSANQAAKVDRVNCDAGAGQLCFSFPDLLAVERALFLSLGAGGEGSVRFLPGARKVGFQLRFAHHAVFRDQIKRKVRG